MGDASSDLMDRSRWEVLWHSLGMTSRNYRRRLDWWLDNENHRNHFAAEPQGVDGLGLTILHGLGYMERGKDIPGGLACFRVTPEGIKAARDEFAAHRKAVA